MDDFRWSMLWEEGPDRNRYRTSISLGCQMLQQLAGTNVRHTPSKRSLTLHSSSRTVRS